MSYRSVLNLSNGGPSYPKLTLKINSLRIKRKAQNFPSWMLSEYTFKIGRKIGDDFLIIVPLKMKMETSKIFCLTSKEKINVAVSRNLIAYRFCYPGVSKFMRC